MPGRTASGGAPFVRQKVRRQNRGAGEIAPLPSSFPIHRQAENTMVMATRPEGRSGQRLGPLRLLRTLRASACGSPAAACGRARVPTRCRPARGLEGLLLGADQGSQPVVQLGVLELREEVCPAPVEPPLPARPWICRRRSSSRRPCRGMSAGPPSADSARMPLRAPRMYSAQLGRRDRVRVSPGNRGQPRRRGLRELGAGWNELGVHVTGHQPAAPSARTRDSRAGPFRADPDLPVPPWRRRAGRPPRRPPG